MTGADGSAGGVRLKGTSPGKAAPTTNGSVRVAFETRRPAAVSSIALSMGNATRGSLRPRQTAGIRSRAMRTVPIVNGKPCLKTLVGGSGRPFL
jgi:hypothetical protein